MICVDGHGNLIDDVPNPLTISCEMTFLRHHFHDLHQLLKRVSMTRFAFKFLDFDESFSNLEFYSHCSSDPS